MKLLGHIFFWVLLIWAWLYAEERVLFVDSAEQLTQLIQTEWFNIAAKRYGASITQLLPLLFIKMGADVNWLVHIYSITFPVTFYGVFLLCGYVFKRWDAAWLVILSYIICIRVGAYHAVAEGQQALAYTSLFFAWIMHASDTKLYGYGMRGKLLKSVVGISIMVLAFLTHPIVVVPLFVVLFWAFMMDRSAGNVLMVFVMTIALFFVAFIKSKFGTGGLETGFVDQVFLVPEIALEIDKQFSYWFFNFHIKHLYRPMFIVFYATTLLFLWQRKWMHALFYVLGSAATLVFMLAVFNGVDSQIMMERAFTPVGFAVCLPFCLIVLRDIKSYLPLKVALLSALLINNGSYIIKTGKYLTERQNYLGELIDGAKAQGISKAILPWEKETGNLLIVGWALPTETLLKSTMRDAENPVTVIGTDDPDLLARLLADSINFYPSHFHEPYPPERMNLDYFRLPQTKYEVLEKFPPATENPPLY